MSTYKITIRSDVPDDGDNGLMVYEIEPESGGAQNALFQAGIKATLDRGPRYAEAHFTVEDWGYA